MRKELQHFCNAVTGDVVLSDPFYVVLSGSKGSGKSLVGCQLNTAGHECGAKSRSEWHKSVTEHVAAGAPVTTLKLLSFLGGAKGG